MDHLMELQNKQSEIRRHIAQLSAQLHAGERVRGTADLSIRYMETLSSSSQVYKPLGKLYVATSKDNLAQELALTIEKSKAESTRLEVGYSFSSLNGSLLINMGCERKRLYVTSSRQNSISVIRRLKTLLIKLTKSSSYRAWLRRSTSGESCLQCVTTWYLLPGSSVDSSEEIHRGRLRS